MQVLFFIIFLLSALTDMMASSKKLPVPKSQIKYLEKEKPQVPASSPVKNQENTGEEEGQKAEDSKKEKSKKKNSASKWMGLPVPKNQIVKVS